MTDHCIRSPPMGKVMRSRPVFNEHIGADMRKAYLHLPWVLASLVGSLFGCGSNPTIPRAEDLREVVVPRVQTGPIVPGPEDLSVPESSPSEPVKAVMKFRPASVSDGSTVELLVDVRIARAHYLHAAGDPGSRFTSLDMEVTLPAGIKFIGGWKFPPPEAGRAGAPVYRNSVLLRRSLKVASTLPPQPLIVAGVLSYQACTDDLCWPPGKTELSATLSTQGEATP